DRAGRRALDHRAVRHGVGERHAELDQVGAFGDGRAHELAGGGEVRVPGHEEGHEGDVVPCPSRRESGSDTAHVSGTRRYSATVFMSLSPRPERLTRRNLLRYRRGARWVTYATALALSIAGMMPSVA